MIVLSCCAPYGVGGLGRTLSDATAALAGEGQACRVFAAGVGTGSALGSALTCVVPRLPGLLARIPPIRFDVGLQQHLAFELAPKEGAAAVPVTYSGVLPDMFAEGREVVVEADYAKGNRFTSISHLTTMPTVRVLGNAMLSFAADAAISAPLHVFAFRSFSAPPSVTLASVTDP